MTRRSDSDARSKKSQTRVMDFTSVTSGFYEEELEVLNVADERVSLSYGEFQANRMTPHERAHFERFGYVVIKDALPPETHVGLCAAVERLRDQKIAEGRPPAEQLRQPLFSPCHDLGSQKCVQDLVCTPKVFPKICDILGHNIFLYHGYVVELVEVFVRAFVVAHVHRVLWCVCP